MIRAFIRRYGRVKLQFLISDLSAFFIGILIVLFIDYNYESVSNINEIPHVEIVIFFFTITISILSFRFSNLYKQKIFSSNVKQLELLLKNSVFTFFILLVCIFFMKYHVFAYYRTKIIFFIIISYFLISFNRFYLIRRIQKINSNSKFLSRNIIAIGAGRIGKRFVKEIETNKLELNFIGFLDDDPSLHQSFIEGYEVFGGIGLLSRIVKEKNIDEIYITMNSVSHPVLLNLLQTCKELHCQTNITSNHFGIIEKKIDNKEYKDLKYVPVYQNLSNIYIEYLKRIFDLILSALLVIVLSPFLLIVGLLIKFSSSGPIIYVSTAIGKNGKSFNFYKFRSMYQNVPNDSHKKLTSDFINGKIVGAKLRNDSRVTPLGHLLRKYSIDEFAQLFNVIRGEMSLVGPRPSSKYEFEMMQEWHKRRFNVLPGMTGLWQTSGRAEVSYMDMIMMDLYYVENCSFWFDIILLLKTFTVVIKGKGGY